MENGGTELTENGDNDKIGHFFNVSFGYERRNTKQKKNSLSASSSVSMPFVMRPQRVLQNVTVLGFILRGPARKRRLQKIVTTIL